MSNVRYTKEHGWTAPEGAREFTTTPRSVLAAVVHDPREYPGVCHRVVTDSEGKVLDSQWVIDTSPFGNHMWHPLRPGDVVVYTNDPSTNMLQVQNGEDFLRWHEDSELRWEIFDAEWGEYPGLYPEEE
jgi:hypothetical protein